MHAFLLNRKNDTIKYKKIFEWPQGKEVELIFVDSQFTTIKGLKRAVTNFLRLSFGESVKFGFRVGRYKTEKTLRVLCVKSGQEEKLSKFLNVKYEKFLPEFFPTFVFKKVPFIHWAIEPKSLEELTVGETVSLSFVSGKPFKNTDQYSYAVRKEIIKLFGKDAKVHINIQELITISLEVTRIS